MIFWEHRRQKKPKSSKALLQFIYQPARMMTSNGPEFHPRSLFKNQESSYFRNLVTIHNTMVREGVNSASQKSYLMTPEKPRNVQISAAFPESSNPGNTGSGSFAAAQQCDLTHARKLFSWNWTLVTKLIEKNSTWMSEDFFLLW